MPDAHTDQDEPDTPPEGQNNTESGHDPQKGSEEPETFPRAYVEQLREENASYRTRAKRADELAQRLYAAQVAALGRLADPTDLPYDEQLLDDPDKLTAAVDALLTRKPHLASRRPAGSIDQGARLDETGVSLLGLLRGNTGPLQ